MTDGLFPVEAARGARAVDTLFWGLTAFSAAVVILVVGLVVVFAIRYRRGSGAKRGELPEFVSREVEIGWTVGTLFLALFIFWWAGSSQLGALVPPADALEIHAVGKQWMWKVQHPSGAREIDALHVPQGQPVRLVMTSQDVIHDFYVPAFRAKTDVLPGRYTQIWFQPTRLGSYPIFCAEYCGTDHSRMGGVVTVLKPQDYARWAADNGFGGDLATQGARLYVRLGCAACHGGKDAPRLDGLSGSRVALADGRSVVADEGYLRTALVEPDKVRVAGFPPAMPAYDRALGEENLIALIAYLKSLHPAGARP